MKEGEEDVYAENKEPVIRFWKTMMEKYGTEKEYNRQIINAFLYGNHPEIIIVVDKLLTGFDAPRNTVLYLTRQLKEHSLLQAIARVNRLHDGKEFGYSLDPRKVRKAVVGWYTERAKDVLRRRLELCHAQIKRLCVSIPKLVIRPMTRRWGSYTKAGSIVLNRELVQAPVHCIDYVIFHELVHSIVPNHGPRFYELLARYLPDWELRKTRLEAAMAQLPGGVFVRQECGLKPP